MLPFIKRSQMKRLGISIYPEIVGKEKTIEYINLAKKYGFTRIFANLLEVEDTKEGREKLAMLKSVYAYAKEKGFEVIVDVNPNFYKAFKLPNDEINFFKKLEVTGIRLDEDFKGVVEAKLSKNKSNLKIELNASAGTETFDLAIANGANVENLIACHNFYPMRYTGLDYDRFVTLSSAYKAKGIRVAAFITLPEKQKGIGPWNVNEGMPTIEKHRDMSLASQVQDFLVLDLVDDIIISQQGTTEAQFKEMKSILDEYNKLSKQKVIDIHVKVQRTATKVEKDIMFINKGKSHFNRPDFNSFFVRSTFPRIDYKEEIIKPKNAGKQVKVGDVVVLNENLGRYKGELHLMTQAIDDSKQNARNVVAKIVKEDINKLGFIRNGKQFRLIEVK